MPLLLSDKIAQERRNLTSTGCGISFTLPSKSTFIHGESKCAPNQLVYIEPLYFFLY